MPTTARVQEGRRRGNVRRLGLLAGVLVAFLVALPALGSAAVHSAPFKGTLITGSTVSHFGCAASAKITAAPSFNFSNGYVRAAAKSAVHGCGIPGFSDRGYTEEVAGYDSKSFTMGSPAAGNASWNWFDAFTYNLSATPMNPAGGPFAWASFSFAVHINVYDLTNHSFAFTSGSVTYFASTNTTSSGNLSGTLAGPTGFSVFQPGLTVTGHSYSAVFYVDIQEWTYAPSGTSTHATAVLGMARPYVVQLTNWTLS